MPIQTIIKQKRKELGLTQEQIADYLGVSTPAVNKWENGATYPDISLLAPLARLLKIDLNTLLCFHEELSAQEICQFSNKVMETITEKGFESGLKMVQEKIEHYPNSPKLVHDMVLLLDGAMMIAGMSESEKEQYDEPIKALYERIIHCNDENIRNSALFMLASKLIQKDEFEKAQEILDLLPLPSVLDKSSMQANLLAKQGKTEQAEEIHERTLLMSITKVWNTLLTLVELELTLENVQTASKLATVCSQTAELFNLSDYYQMVPHLSVALAKKEEQECLTLTESLLKSSHEMWNSSDSILFRHLSLDTVPENRKIQILPALISEIETNSKYDFLRKNNSFQDLIKKYHTESI